MTAPLRVGISGFGGTGRFQADAFRSVAGCSVAAVFDPKPGGRARAAATLPDALVTDGFDALLDSGIDVVGICSPFPVHADQAVRALQAGKHVLCEQPFAGSTEDCRRIVAAARARPDLHLGVQRVFRRLPLHIAAKRSVESGDLGRVALAEARSVVDATKRLGLHDTWALDDPPPALLLFGCHPVDLLRWIVGDEVRRVAGAAASASFPAYREADHCAVVLEFRSGPLGAVTVSLSAGRPADHTLRVTGSKRCIEGNLLLGAADLRTLAGPRLRHRTGGSARARAAGLVRDLRHQLAPVLGHALFRAASRAFGPRGPYPLVSYPYRLHDHAVAVAAGVAEFAEGVRSRAPDLESALDAARTVAVCLAGVEACRTGAWVGAAFPDEDDAEGPGSRSSVAPGTR